MARRRDIHPPSDFRTILRLTLSSILAYLLVYLSYLRYLNPFYVISQRQRKLYYVDASGNILCKPNFFQRIVDILQSDATNKRKLLSWAQSKLPALKVTNFSTSWQDGIALCTLIEALCPGACPRHDLLKPHHRVNNCRLGLKLSQKHLETPQGIITPEEMAIADESTEPKIRQLLTVIKWASAKKAKEAAPTSKGHWKYIPSSDSIERVTRNCEAKGNGLLMGLVGKRCKFHIYADSQGLLDLQIEIKGPNNEICSEKIMSLFPTRRMSRLLNTDSLDQASARLRMTGSEGDVKYFEDNRGNTYIRQKSIDVVDERELQKIPFDYQCVGDGKYLVSYVPRSPGKHTIHVFWQGHHITGSPFTAKIAESAVHLERQFSRESQRNKLRQQLFGSMDSSSGASFEAKDSNSMDPREQVNKPEATAGEKDLPPLVMLARQLQKTGRTFTPPTHESDAELQPHQTSLGRIPKQGTVTRRRVLRRVVTKGGKDITLTEFGLSPSVSRQSSLSKSPTLSRQSSIDCSRSPDSYSNRVHEDPPPSSPSAPLVSAVEKKGLETVKESSVDALAPPLRTMSRDEKRKIIAERIQSFVQDTQVDSDNEKTEQFAGRVVDSAINSAMSVISNRHCESHSALDITDSAFLEADKPSNLDPQLPSVTPGDTKEYEREISDDTKQITESNSVNSRFPEQPDTEVDKGRELRDSSTHGSSKPKSPPDSPTLKLLQSESLSKVCYYISQRALTHSTASLQSQASECTLIPSVRLQISEASETGTVSSSNDSSQTVFANVLTGCSERELHESKKELGNLDGPRGSDETNSLAQKEVVPGQCDSNRPVLEEIEKAVPTADVKGAIGTERALQIQVQTASSQRSGRRGSLVRQDVALCHKSSDGSSSDSERISLNSSGRSNSTTKKIPRQPGTNSQQLMANAVDPPEKMPRMIVDKSFTSEAKSSTDEQTNTKGFSIIADITRSSPSPAWFSSQIQIRIPTPKTDKWTQVTNDEIKAATGWRSPIGMIRQRKMYRLIQETVDIPSGTLNGQTDRATSHNTTGAGINCARGRSPFSVWYGDNLPQIVYEPPLDRELSTEDKNALPNGQYDVQRWLQDNQSEMSGLQPVRQSTVETVDSGIAESRCSSPGRFWRRQRNSLPNPSAHRLLLRQANQIPIELDPSALRSVSNSPSGDEEKENSSPKRWTTSGQRAITNPSPHREVVRSYSDGKRSKRTGPVREDSCSLSDTELNKASRGPNTRRPGNKSKVARRSSGRSLKSNSRRGADAAKILGSGSVAQSPEATDALQDKTITVGQMRKMKFRRRSFAVESLETSENDALAGGEHSAPSEDEHLKQRDQHMPLPLKSENVSKTSSARRKSYGGTPSSRKRGLQLQRSSTLNDDAYCGFGLSKSHRDELLNQINLFSNLHEKDSDKECGDDNSNDKRDQISGTTDLVPASISLLDKELYTQSGESVSDFLPLSDSSDMLGDLSPRGLFDSPETSNDCCPLHGQDFSCSCDKLGSVQDQPPPATNPVREFLDLILRIENEKNGLPDDDDLGEESDHDPEDVSYCNPSRCRAIGAGLQAGFVETPINFQVLVDGAGNGHLTIGITGPRPNTVKETSVTYTGDNLYEVIYDVTQPGYYVIDVKWADIKIPESPFIAKVTL